MATMRELKGRIDSVHSSQKITGAMKMISSARLRKAESVLLQSQPYRQQLKSLYNRIMAAGSDSEPAFVRVRKVKNVALVIFASDDGLCGAFNISLYKKLVQAVAACKAAGAESVTVYPVGRKIAGEVKRIAGIDVVKASPLFDQKLLPQATKELADELAGKFLAGEIDRADIIYTRYKSIGSQTILQQQFLPVVKEELKEERKEEMWYIYEPGCAEILDRLYPLMLHALMYEALLENRTSEQAARILAMQSANDNAIKLLGNLHLEYNKLRQQGITSELLDIVGGSVK